MAKVERKFVTVERKAEIPQYGQFFKFESAGDSVEGIYKSMRRNAAKIVDDVKFKSQNVYDLESDDGELHSIGGNFDLDDKMRRVKKGSYVKITYKDDETISDNPEIAPMKVFIVEVAPPEVKKSEVKK